MKLRLEVINIEGESVIAETIISDFVAWERHSKKKISNLSEGAGIEDMAFLAYTSLKRQKKVDISFEEWLESVTELNALEADESPKSGKRAR